jgi:hypothetical protein
VLICALKIAIVDTSRTVGRSESSTELRKTPLFHARICAMSKRFQVGARVRASAVKARGLAWAQSNLGDEWQSVYMAGAVEGYEGKKTLVRWDDGVTTALGA